MYIYNKSPKVCNKESSCVQFNFQGRISSLNHRIKTQTQNRVALKELFFQLNGKAHHKRQVGSVMNPSEITSSSTIKAPLNNLLHLGQARKKRQTLHLTLFPRSYCQPNIARSCNIVNQLHHGSSNEHFQGANNQGKNKPTIRTHQDDASDRVINLMTHSTRRNLMKKNINHQTSQRVVNQMKRQKDKTSNKDINQSNVK